MERVSNYFKGAFSEIRKVTWPTRKEAAKLTFAVIVFSLLFAFFTAIIDFGMSNLFENVFLRG